MSIPASSTMTPAEYLAFERRSEERHEYVNGRVHALAGTSREHSLVAGDVFALLLAQLRGRPCEVHASDIRVRVGETGMYTYPDVVVACGAPEWEDDQVDTLLNPTLIVEVLSPSTERYDRGAKFAHYRRLPSLVEYVLVAPDRPWVERFVRQGDVWVLSEATGLDAVMPLDAVGSTLPLRDVYARVTFDDSASRAPVV